MKQVTLDISAKKKQQSTGKFASKSSSASKSLRVCAFLCHSIQVFTPLSLDHPESLLLCTAAAAAAADIEQCAQLHL